MFVAVVLAAAASVCFMGPALVAPVAGDDRVWYPEVGALESFNVGDELRDVPQWWQQRIDRGRANVLTDLERRSAGRLVVDASVGTGAPTYLVNGVLKLLLAATAVLTLAALLKSLRCRRRDGALVRLPGRTVVLCTVAGGILLALGSQPAFHEVNGRNGWVTYPTHTYGAVLSILGVTALVLWLTRLYAEGRSRLAIVLVLVVLAGLTNLRYELVFAAGPVSLIALLLVPVTPAQSAADGRRAKWVTGIAFVGVFTTILVVLRVYVRRVCEVDGCYVGTTPRLSWELLSTFGQNVASSVPGTTAPAVADFVETWGVSAHGLYLPTAWSVLVGTGMAVGLLASWWSARPGRSSPHATAGDAPGDDGFARGSDEGRLLMLAAVLCLLGALAAAGVMSLSAGAQTSSELGLPYRNAVVTWAGLAWAVGLGMLALRQTSFRAGTVGWVVLSVVVGATAACLLPANERSLAADRVANRATTAAFAALVEGDLDDSANDRRCELVPEIREERVDAAEAFDSAFRRLWGQAFCQR